MRLLGAVLGAALETLKAPARVSALLLKTNGDFAEIMTTNDLSGTRAYIQPHEPTQLLLQVHYTVVVLNNPCWCTLRTTVLFAAAAKSRYNARLQAIQGGTMSG